MPCRPTFILGLMEPLKLCGVRKTEYEVSKEKKCVQVKSLKDSIAREGNVLCPRTEWSWTEDMVSYPKVPISPPIHRHQLRNKTKKQKTARDLGDRPEKISSGGLITAFLLGSHTEGGQLPKIYTTFQEGNPHITWHYSDPQISAPVGRDLRTLRQLLDSLVRDHSKDLVAFTPGKHGAILFLV